MIKILAGALAAAAVAVSPANAAEPAIVDVSVQEPWASMPNTGKW